MAVAESLIVLGKVAVMLLGFAGVDPAGNMNWVFLGVGEHISVTECYEQALEWNSQVTEYIPGTTILAVCVPIVEQKAIPMTPRNGA